MTTSPRRLAALAAAIGLLGLIGCGKPPTAARQSNAAPDLSKVTLVLGDQAHLLEARAEAAGALAGAPYRILWANFQGAAPLFEALNAGAVDTAPAGDTPVLMAAATQAPFKIVAASVTRESRAVGILVPPASPIRTIADLKGHTVIVSSARGSIAQYLLLGALKEAGLTPGDIKIGYMLPLDAQAGFASNRIEAWATFGSYQAFAEKNGARLLRDGHGINTGIGLIAASDQALSDPGKRAAIADVLKRFAKAEAWSDAHPEQYAVVMSRTTGMPIDVARILAGWQRSRLRPIDDDIVGRLQTVADTFYREKVFPVDVHVDHLADRSVFTASIAPLSPPGTTASTHPAGRPENTSPIRRGRGPWLCHGRVGCCGLSSLAANRPAQYPPHLPTRFAVGPLPLPGGEVF